jgi:hypothetical protein
MCPQCGGANTPGVKFCEEADSLLAEAREIFERLEAEPWLERADTARTEVPA